jgi:hypothetical protein
MKTSELTGIALDWAVATCEGHTPNLLSVEGQRYLRLHKFSTDWAQGGPIIERELLLLRPCGLSWECSMGGDTWFKGATPLIATMRCYVASKLGDEVKIQKELVS